MCNADPGFLPEIPIRVLTFPFHEHVQRATAPSLMAPHRHDAAYRPPSSIVRLLAGDNGAHGNTLPNLTPDALHLLSAPLRTLWVPPWLNLNPHRFAHVRRLLPTQRVARRSLLRSVKQLTDPDEVTKSQVVDPHRLPFTSMQYLLEFKEGPQALMTKLEPLLRLGLQPPVKTFPQLSQNRNRKLEKDFSRLRTQWRIFLSISRTSSRAPVLT